jgi:hypothetical protein
MTTRKEPSGGKHGPCMTHVQHPYTTNGWLCVNDEPGRAETMVDLADELTAIVARHHEAEAQRPAADGTYARWHAPVDYMPDGRPVMPGGVCTMQNAHNGPRAFCGGTIHMHTMGGPAVRSQCAGHTCGPKVAPVVETPAPIVKARKVGPRHVHATAEGGAVFAGDTCATCGTTIPRQDPAYAAGVQGSRILSAPFALPDPIAPADALDIYDERANVDAARTILETPAEHSTVVVELARTILAPARSMVEPSRPEPIPAARPPLAVVPDARATDDRPRCARCGQTFRKSGIGAEWHRINRPDCRAESRRATA